MGIPELQKMNSDLDKALAKRSQDDLFKRIDNQGNLVVKEIKDSLQPLVDSASKAQQEQIKATVDTLNTQLQKQQDILDKGVIGITKALSDIKISGAEIKIPSISSPDVKVVVDTKGIEKTLQKGLQSLKPPIVNIPKADITVKVPKMDFKWPEGDMSVRGIVDIAGVDLNNPLPVQLRDSKGKPVDFNIGGGSSGKSGGGAIKNQSGPITAANPLHISSSADLNYDTTSIDSSDPASIVITYLLSSVLVATETITISGTTIDIVKT